MRKLFIALLYAIMASAALAQQISQPGSGGNNSGITALTGDVTASGSGSVAATVAKIAGVAVGTPTGTGNVVFSASPTLSGTLTAAALTTSGLMKFTGTATTSSLATSTLCLDASGNVTSSTINCVAAMPVTVQTVAVDTDGATITFNLATSNWHGVTLGGNRTLAFSGGTTGQQFTLVLTQDGTGSRTVTWPSGITWDGGGSAPVLQTAAGAVDTITLKQTGAGTYLGYPTISTITAGTGLAISGTTISSNAEQTINYQPGLLTSINANPGAFTKFVKAATVDNIIGSAVTFTCSSNPTVTVYECGTSTTCASPTAIGTVTLTAAGTAVVGTITSAAVTAGDYVAFEQTAGTCTALDIAVTAQVHSN